MSSLTPQEKVKIRHHCGFLNASQMMTYVLGSPAAVETQFIIEGAMDRLPEVCLPEVRRLLTILDGIEEQMVEVVQYLVASKLGEIEIDPNVQKKLVLEYDRWVAALCNLMGIERNPFDRRRSAMSMNVRVAR